MRSPSGLAFYSSVAFAILSTFSVIVSGSSNIHSKYELGTETQTKRLSLMESSDQVSILEIGTRDYISDMIRNILRMEVTELLVLIDDSLWRKRTHTSDAITRLNEIKVFLDPATVQKIDTLVVSKLLGAVDNVTPITNDLDRVLPAIFNRMNRSRDVADLIQALLTISLEQFLLKIQAALELSDRLLLEVMNDLITISNSVQNAQLSKELRDVSTVYLAHARAAIRPILDSLYRVFPPMHISASRGIVADIFSEVLRFDVTEAANMFTDIWVRLNNILDNSLGRLENMPFADDVKADVKSKVVKTVEEVTRSLSPLLEVLVHFAYENNTKQLTLDRNRPEDIVDTLIGVSFSDFIHYIDFSVNRTKQFGDAIQEDVIKDVSTSHPEFGIRIAIWAYTTVNQLKRAIKPFLDLIDPILPPLNQSRKWIGQNELYSSAVEIHAKTNRAKTDDMFCDFSLKTGQNKDYVYQIVSKIFRFEVSEAAETLMTNMIEVEVMLNDHFDRLSHVLNESNVDLKVTNKLHTIIEEALNDTKRAIQPGLDIFLLFASNNSMNDREVMAGIIKTLSAITLEEFVQYSRGTMVIQGFIIENAVTAINDVLVSNNVELEVTEEIQNIISSAVQSGSEIMSPFIGAISTMLSA